MFGRLSPNQEAMQFNIPEEDKNKSGIYIIRNTVNSRVYVGSTNQFKKRYNQHISPLRRGCHPNIKLQRFVKKYSLEALSFAILEFCDQESLLEREQYWINHLQSFNQSKGFNISPVAGRVCLTPERKAKNVKTALRKGTQDLAKCLSCGKEFIYPTAGYKASGGLRKYCSKECAYTQQVHHGPTLQKPCKHCGKAMDFHWLAKFKTQLYCGQECRYAAAKGVKIPTPSKLLNTFRSAQRVEGVICLKCGIRFYPKVKGRKYCSRGCAKWCIKINWKGHISKKVKYTCETCKKEFLRLPSKIKHKPGLSKPRNFCSKVCQRKPPLIKNCQYCSLPFTVKNPSKPNTRFCSTSCAVRSRFSVIKHYPPPSYTPGKQLQLNF